jgi:hypothetical protein
LSLCSKNVDARVKPGHDGREICPRPYPLLSCFSEAVAGLAPLPPETRT